MKKFFYIIYLISAFNLLGQFSTFIVNKPTSTDPNEVTIAINSVSPNNIAAGANINYFYHSANGGKTWVQSNMSSTLGVWGDPCLVYDTEGNLYYGHLSNPVSGYWIDRIVIQKSTDNGLTWDNGSGIGYTYPKNKDKEWIAVDHSNSIYRNNIYVSWTEFDGYASTAAGDSSRILFSRSTNTGENWSEPLVISDVAGNCVDEDETVEGAVPAIGPDGEIYIAWAGPLGLMFDRSFDGGENFGKDIFISEIPGGWDFAIPGINRANGLPITACDISNSEFRGNVYVCWADQRNGTADTDIYFVKSTDKGSTWGETIKVNNDSSGKQQFFPWMTVDSTNGNIYTVFYDRRSTSNNYTDVYIARSTDGGETFENYLVTNEPFNPTSSYFFGDYTNIAAYNGKIYPIWMQLQDGKRSVHCSVIDDKNLVVGIEPDKIEIPESYSLLQNYPNPFNGETKIGYSIPISGDVEIELFNILGERVAVLESGLKTAGYHEISISSNSLNSGVYFYSSHSNNYSDQKKLIVLK